MVQQKQPDKINPSTWFYPDQHHQTDKYHWVWDDFGEGPVAIESTSAALKDFPNVLNLHKESVDALRRSPKPDQDVMSRPEQAPSILGKAPHPSIEMKKRFIPVLSTTTLKSELKNLRPGEFPTAI